MRKIIGIFGLSGVGKSKLSERICSYRNDFVCTRASDILKTYGGATDFDDLAEYSVSANQNILINGFQIYQNDHKEKNIIIELHNVIETPECLINVDDSIFNQLNLDAAYFLYLNPEILIANRLSDNKRKRAIIPLRDIAKRQRLAIEVFESCFSSLRIPHVVLDRDFYNNFCVLINSMEL